MSEQGLPARIDADIVSAMKARDAFRVETLRMVKTALKNKAIDKREPLTDAEALAVLTTLLKQRRESVEQFTKGNRPELAQKEQDEIALIETYMPQQADAATLTTLVDSVLAELQAQGTALEPKQMGAAMKAVNERIRVDGLRADGRVVSELVKAALNR